MECFYNHAWVPYPCSGSCHLFGDCMVQWAREQTELGKKAKAMNNEAAPSEERKRKTNFDRIREMSVKEFSKKFFEAFDCEECGENDETLCKRTCAENYKDWLMKDWEE